MKAIHLRTAQLAGEWSRITIETTLKRIRGVTNVAIVASVGLVSVLFDETKASAEQIVHAVTSLGFEVRPLQPGL